VCFRIAPRLTGKGTCISRQSGPGAAKYYVSTNQDDHGMTVHDDHGLHACGSVIRTHSITALVLIGPKDAGDASGTVLEQFPLLSSGSGILS